MPILKRQSLEEKFLFDIVFSKKELSKQIFNDINFELLVKKTSEFLSLPLLYFKLREKKYLKYIPSDLENFLKEIYLINKKRNKDLLYECKLIAEIFYTHRIDYVFLKGSAIVLQNNIIDLGVRMIGDIDILVSNNHFQKSIKLLKDFGYKKSKGYREINTRHYPRLINKNKIFAVEIHRHLLKYSKRKLLNEKNFLNSKISSRESFVPCNIHMLKHIIYNHQINDNGSLRASYNIRSLYDFKLFSSLIEKNRNLLNFLYVEIYLVISDYLEITNNVKEIKFISNKLYRMRMIMKYEYKTWFYIDQLVCNLILYFKNKIKQIYEAIMNKKYILEKFRLL